MTAGAAGEPPAAATGGAAVGAIGRLIAVAVVGAAEARSTSCNDVLSTRSTVCDTSRSLRSVTRVSPGTAVVANGSTCPAVTAGGANIENARSARGCSATGETPGAKTRTGAATNPGVSAISGVAAANAAPSRTVATISDASIRGPFPETAFGPELSTGAAGGTANTCAPVRANPCMSPATDRVTGPESAPNPANPNDVAATARSSVAKSRAIAATPTETPSSSASRIPIV